MRGNLIKASSCGRRLRRRLNLGGAHTLDPIRQTTIRLSAHIYLIYMIPQNKHKQNFLYSENPIFQNAERLGKQRVFQLESAGRTLFVRGKPRVSRRSRRNESVYSFGKQKNLRGRISPSEIFLRAQLVIRNPHARCCRIAPCVTSVYSSTWHPYNTHKLTA